MKTIIEVLTEIVSNAFAKCGYSSDLGLVMKSDRPDLAEYQANGAFAGAKMYKVAPMVIANNVKKALDNGGDKEAFSQISVEAPGFLNLSLANDYVIKLITQMKSDENLGIPQIGCGQRVVIDYGGPNIAKPLHIGHLRSAIIGESIKRIARAVGYDAIGDVHLGDWGMPIGLVLAELEERENANKVLSYEELTAKLTIDYLNELYPIASKKSKTDEIFKKKAQNITNQIQNGHQGYLALWEKIVSISVNDLKGSYNKLNVEFDLWNGESDAQEYIPELIETLSNKGLLYKNLGAMVVDVANDNDNEPMPPIIIKKSDDSSLYATTDLATIIKRQKEHSPNKYWYVVDNRQNLHFKQVFRCAIKADLAPKSTEFEFLGFGTMNGKDGRPYKTRDGGVMKLSELLETAKREALQKAETSTFVDESEEIKRENAEKVSVAAIKFGDLINNRSKDYTFDLDRFLASDGKTGVYLLYTISRINSILKKAGGDYEDCELTGIYSPEEKNALLNILRVGDIFKLAITEKDPHYICESAYQIASAFSKFYNSNKILAECSEEKKKSWLALAALVKTFLLKHLSVVGIEPVEQM